MKSKQFEHSVADKLVAVVLILFVMLLASWIGLSFLHELGWIQDLTRKVVLAILASALASALLVSILYSLSRSK